MDNHCFFGKRITDFHFFLIPDCSVPDSKRYSKCQLYNLVDKVLHNPQQPPISSPLSHKNPMVVSYDNSILFVGGEEFSDQKAPQVLQYKVGENFTMDTWEKLDQKLPFEFPKENH